jgi:hypothetical protein
MTYLSTRLVYIQLQEQKANIFVRSWWFASTVIPILAACIGPLANVLSLASLVTKWKDSLPDNGVLPAGADNNGIPIPDSHWYISAFSSL